MDIYEELKKIWKNLNITMPEVIAFAAVIFIFGILLLSFAFILPILVSAAAILIIVGIVYVVYKALGGS